MKRILSYMSGCIAAIISVACGDATPDSIDKMSVSLTPGEAFETELTFTVKSQNVANCAWVCVKEGSAVPSDVDIMSKGKPTFANSEATLKASNLEPATTYVIVAAAMNGDGDIITSEHLKMTTLEREANPTVSLSSGSPDGSSYTFTLTYADAEECRYKVYADGETASVEDILSTGVKVSADETQTLTVEGLEDGIYFLMAAAKNGEVTSLSNKLMFTISTEATTFTISPVKAWINPDLETNGQEWIVRFYFYDAIGEYTNVAISLVAPENGHDYLPAGSYVFGAESGYKVDPEYSSYTSYYIKFVSGYCNVSIKGKEYTFDVYLLRDEDEYDFSGCAFTLNWTGTIENMPIP